MDRKLCPGIQSPLPPLKFSPPLSGKAPLYNPEIFQPPPLLNFGMNLNPPPPPPPPYRKVLICMCASPSYCFD